MAIAIVATGSAHEGSVTISTVGADCIVIFTTDILVTYADPTDNQGNNYAANALTGVSDGIVFDRAYVVAAPNTDASHQFTITGNGFNTASMVVYALSGVDASPVDDLDTQNDSNPFPSTTKSAPTTTPTQNDDIIINCVSFRFTTAAPMSIDSGFSVDEEIAVANHCLTCASLIQTTAANTTPTWTYQINDSGYGCFTALALKAAAGGTTFDEDYAGTITPAGALAKLISKAFDGSVTPAGALNKSQSKAFTGSSTPAGAIAKQIGKSQAGSMTPSGDPNLDIGKSLQGAITPAGAMTLIRAILRTFDGTITPVGTLVFSIGKGLSGLITPAGALVKSIGKTLAGAAATVGSLAKQTGKVFGGLVTPAGDLTAVRTIILALSGTITPVGSLVRLIGKSLAGLITSIGSMVISGGTPQAPPIFGGTIEIQHEQHTIRITEQAQTIDVGPHPRE